LAYLEAYNEKAGQELDGARKEAKLWQQRVSYVLQQAAACQLRTYTDSQLDRGTQSSQQPVGMR